MASQDMQVPTIFNYIDCSCFLLTQAEPLLFLWKDIPSSRGLSLGTYNQYSPAFDLFPFPCDSPPKSSNQDMDSSLQTVKVFFRMLDAK